MKEYVIKEKEENREKSLLGYEIKMNNNKKEEEKEERGREKEGKGRRKGRKR